LPTGRGNRFDDVRDKRSGRSCRATKNHAESATIPSTLQSPDATLHPPVVAAIGPVMAAETVLPRDKAVA